MSAWLPVGEALPEAGATVLVWVRQSDGTGGVMLAAVRAERLIRPAGHAYYVKDLNFVWSGGDNVREWAQSRGWLGEGGYWWGEGDRVTHWMPLPEEP